MRTTSRLGVATITAALATAAFAGSAALAQDPVEGTIDVHGSSTVYPISTLVSEKLAAIEGNEGFGYTVGFEGTGDGFNQFFCPNVSDVSDASRPMRDSEAEICAENGVTWTELKIAYDGMAVLTSPDNPLECVNFLDLYAVFGAESNDINTYEDATAFAQELGSSTDLGTGRIQNTAPGPESGTFDSFAEIVLEDIADERGVEGDAHRDPVPPAWTGAANDQVIIAGISQARNPSVYTFVGLAYAAEAGDSVKVLAVDSGDGNCVLPSAETVSSGEYPISRPLFIYPALDRIEQNPVIVPWVDFYLSDEGIASVVERDYVPLPAEELEQTRAQWDAAKAGDESALNARTWATAE
ncbi:MAG: substrate-binding domain-containing protein, partial [Chloroflexota bacterium]